MKPRSKNATGAVRFTAEICLDAAGRILRLAGNPAPMVGGDALGALGKSIFDFIHPDSHAAALDAFRRCLNNGENAVGEFRFRGSDDLLRLDFIKPAARDTELPPETEVLVFEAMSFRKDIGALSHELFSSALNELGEGIIVYDDEFRVTQINDALVSALGLESMPVEVIDTQRLSARFPGLIPSAEEFQRIFESGREHHKIAQITNTHDIQKNFVLNFYPVRTAEGTVVQIVETIQEFIADQETVGKMQLLYRRLQEKVRVLSVLNKLSNDFAISTDEEELYPRITRSLVWGLGLHDTVAVLSLRNADTGELELRSIFGLEQYPVDKLIDKPEQAPEYSVISERMDKLLPDLYLLGLRSAIFSPIIVDGQNIGWINIFHRTREPQISEEETLVRILTENLKHFIKRWSAERLLREKVLTLLILRQVSDALQVGKSLEHITYTFLTGVTAEEGVGFNRAFLFLMDTEEERLGGEMAVGPASAQEAGEIWSQLRTKGYDFSDLLLDFDSIERLRAMDLDNHLRNCFIPWTPDSAFFAAFENKAPQIMHLEDIVDDNERSALSSLGCTSFVLAPLFATDRPLGVLIADNAITGSLIRGEDIRFLELMCKAGQAGIENIQLYEELHSKIESLKRSNVLMQEHRVRLAQLERLGAVGEMATSVAHEIRNPLVIIGGFARSLYEDHKDDDQHRRYLKIIIDEVARLELVVTDLLDFAKPMKPRFRTVPIRDLIQQTVEIVEPEFIDAQVQILTRLDKSGILAWVDPDLIKHVLFNLMQNALNAMPEGGKLFIFTRPGKEFLHIGLRDTGCGIPPENMEKIFEPFFTTRSSGTGLGLPIVQKIIRSHGGRITIRSRPGRGTKFLISLPYGEFGGGRQT